MHGAAKKAAGQQQKRCIIEIYAKLLFAESFVTTHCELAKRQQ
jgi:hypothetical protein